MVAFYSKWMGATQPTRPYTACRALQCDSSHRHHQQVWGPAAGLPRVELAAPPHLFRSLSHRRPPAVDSAAAADAAAPARLAQVQARHEDWLGEGRVEHLHPVKRSVRCVPAGALKWTGHSLAGGLKPA